MFIYSTDMTKLYSGSYSNVFLWAEILLEFIKFEQNYIQKWLQILKDDF